MPSQTFPIVGARFRPPATALLDVLSIGTPLLIRGEPENSFDLGNAIAVWLATADISQGAKQTLAGLLPGYGWSLDRVEKQDFFHVGYIPKEMAKKMRLEMGFEDGHDYPVEFACGANGGPRVRIEVAEESNDDGE